MIKLKRLHDKDTYLSKHTTRNYQHNSCSSEYGYKDYRINGTSLDWNVYGTDGRRLNPTTPDYMSFKEAKEWLENYLKEKGEIK